MEAKVYKLISWNVNGLRACIKKGFKDFFNSQSPDYFCVQEIKMLQNQEDIGLNDYYQYWNSAERKGYSGTLIFAKVEASSIKYGFSNMPVHDNEGRITILENEHFYLVNVYSPNSKEELLRLNYRMTWEDNFRELILSLDKIKPVIICGDMNVAHQEIDLKHPSTNRHHAGFTDEERQKFSDLLNSGFTDSFRYMYPDAVKYSWWSYRANARANNAGWRIDYFLVSNRIKDHICKAFILNDIYGSDHCPVGLEIRF